MNFATRKIFKLAALSSGSRAVQRLLRIIVRYSQFLLGIGAGSPDLSGEEHAICTALKDSEEPLCVFDVGANRGEYTKLVLRLCSGRRVIIHAFEPSAEAAERFRNLVPSSPDIHLNQMGLTAAPGSAELFYNAPGSVYASLTPACLEPVCSGVCGSEIIKLDTLSAYSVAHGIDHIDLLKIDVEGHEMDVLRGAGEMLEPRFIRAIQFEFGIAAIYTRTFFRDFWELLKPLGYQIVRITPSGHLEPILAYSPDLEVFRTQNFLAMAPEPAPLGSLR